ncbi:hypothetical protein [Cerasicoccus fimbriatus]|uniref:hypothetical protein n=1 Tax=Cerasicoccus fimbriatus TaxID=3014554 RepID=UPI0022B2B728|nr:hypothetical protein [Cerasicoccus sp. TK19100]
MQKKVNLASVLTAIVLFFLPWVQVSCQEGVVRQSGVQAIRGDVTVIKNGEAQKQPRTVEKKNDFPEPAWLILAAFVSLCGAGALGIWSWFAKRSALDQAVVWICVGALILVLAQSFVGFPLFTFILQATDKAAFDDELWRSYQPAFYALWVALFLPITWRIADKKFKGAG